MDFAWWYTQRSRISQARDLQDLRIRRDSLLEWLKSLKLSTEQLKNIKKEILDQDFNFWYGIVQSKMQK